MTEPSFLDPLKLGALELPNRIVMAPMTRMRATADQSPSALSADYYAQRSSAGLIVAEGTAVSAAGQGYPHAPGIFTDAHVQAWQRVTATVHASGGRIFLQIAHNGRNSHSSLLPNGAQPVSASDVVGNIPALTADFQQVPAEVPRALETDEVVAVVADFRKAARRAMEAGFDGVELQAANSHLIDQFLEDGTNRRTDRYGGSLENRTRFLLELVEQVASEIGMERVGVRLSPFGRYGGIQDSNPLQLFTYVINKLSEQRLSYLHLIEGRASEIGLADDLHQDALNNARIFRPSFAGPLISAGGYTPASAEEALRLGHADAIAFGRLFISNPDLVGRIGAQRALNAYQRSTFYGGAEHGYTDYLPFAAGLNGQSHDPPPAVAP